LRRRRPNAPSWAMSLAVNVLGGEFGQAVLFEIAPDVFGGIEFGRVSRKRGGINLSPKVFEIFPHAPAAVDHGSAPDDQQLWQFQPICPSKRPTWVGVVFDVKPGLDDLGDTPGGSQFVGKTVFARPSLEGAFENWQILELQARWPSA